MPSHNGPAARRRRSASVAWDLAFDAEVRRLPAREQARLRRRLCRWLNTRPRFGLRRRPPRVFRVIRPTGGWDPLF
jgi:hypothetical protein